MIHRIVKMEFRPEETEVFKALFESVKANILAFPGCTSLRLLQDQNSPVIFFTYSYWHSAADLEAYRHSELFKGTWKQTKPLFAAPAKAWSTECLHIQEKSEL